MSFRARVWHTVYAVTLLVGLNLFYGAVLAIAVAEHSWRVLAGASVVMTAYNAVGLAAVYWLHFVAEREGRPFHPPAEPRW